MGIFKKVKGITSPFQPSRPRPLLGALRLPCSSAGVSYGSVRCSRAPPGTQAEIKKNYNVGKQLGSGNFAVVKQATALKEAEEGQVKKGDEVAIKVIDKAKVEDMEDIQVTPSRRGTEPAPAAVVDSPVYLRVAPPFSAA